MSLRAAGVGCTALVLALAGCGGSGGAGDGRVAVVATTSHVADIAEKVGGPDVSVRRLLPAAADPHDYEPRPSDARAIAEADLVVRSGGDVDSWLDDLIDDAGGERAALDLLDVVRRRGEDPHWWQDPRNGERAAATVAAALARIDPDRAAGYRSRAKAYVARLRRLDAGIARCIERVPPAKRKLVTTHDALGYYADRYGLEVIGAVIPSLSSQAQASAGETDRLVRQVRDEGVEAIFPESALNPKLERAIAREAGVRVGRALWADTLGPEGSDGATYIEAMASDTAAIVSGLSGGRERCRPRI
jgi:zinc/manganese transport system substrate-binding protein